MNEEEDLAVLIYKSSKTAKARAAAAAAAAAKEKAQISAPSAEARQTTSTRKRSSAHLSGNNTSARAAAKRMSPSKRERQSLLVEHEGRKSVPKHVARKKYRYECSADGCANNSRRGGVCVKHGAKHKQCIRRMHE